MIVPGHLWSCDFCGSEDADEMIVGGEINRDVAVCGKCIEKHTQTLSALRAVEWTAKTAEDLDAL